jgi:hypothetical protein
MISSIIQIIIGLLVWKIVPDWIEVKSRKNKNMIRLSLNIIGVVIILFGIVSLIKSLISMLH